MVTQISNLKQQSSKSLSAKISDREMGVDELFQRVVCADDRKAFESIFNKLYKMLCHLSFRLVKSTELAEEIVDDVFYSLWKNRKSINIGTSFRPYLAASVRNRSLDYLRRVKNEKKATLEMAADVASAEAIISDAMAYEELQRCIVSAIESLPPQCKLIFRMSRDQDLTYKAISEKLGLSIKTVDTQMGRALKHLRGRLNSFSI